MQQVRAEVGTNSVDSFEYLFERERMGWDPVLSVDEQLYPPHEIDDKVALNEAQGNERYARGWKLVTELSPRLGATKEKDEAALKLASPESGSFILVSLRRRRRA
jgi:hypothetical protein